MGKSLNDHRTNRQPKVRSWVAIDAHMRSSAGAMGKFGSGRSRKDSRSRSNVKAALRHGDW